LPPSVLCAQCVSPSRSPSTEAMCQIVTSSPTSDNYAIFLRPHLKASNAEPRERKQIPGSTRGILDPMIWRMLEQADFFWGGGGARGPTVQAQDQASWYPGSPAPQRQDTPVILTAILKGADTHIEVPSDSGEFFSVAGPLNVGTDEATLVTMTSGSSSCLSDDRDTEYAQHGHFLVQQLLAEVNALPSVSCCLQ
jgi:hypothetical protein